MGWVRDAARVRLEMGAAAGGSGVVSLWQGHWPDRKEGREITVL